MHPLPPARRRIVLMRHGAVDYFRPDGTPVAADTVPLSELGRTQADAAGALIAQCGVRFDRVVTSGLPRTVETAQRVLAAGGPLPPIEVEPALREIRGGRLADIPPDRIEAAFTGAFTGRADAEARRFLGGESIGEMLDRVLPAFDTLLQRLDWDCMLLVLHGGVNRAILSRALVGGRAFLGSLEQSPACINLIDVGAADFVVRTTNLTPTHWLHEHERHTTMERLLAQYLGRRSEAIQAKAGAV